MNLCVFGAASSTVDSVYMQAAERFGELAARHGHTVLFGGGCTGLMGALANGVLDEGGTLVGIAPRFFFPMGVLHENCTEMILTETIAERLAIMEERADCYAVLPGGIGTMQELFEVITLKQLDRISGRVGILNVGGYYDPLIDMLENSAEKDFVHRRNIDELFVTECPEKLLEMLETAG